MRNRIRPAAIAMITGAAVALSACGADDQTRSDASDEATPHGYVQGAQEKPEPQISLAYAAAGDRRIRLVDVATEATSTVDLSIPIRRLDEDGRFVYATDGTTVEVVDSGGWTVDHSDHVHYYRAPSAALGTVTASAAVTSIAGAGPLTALGSEDGSVMLLDRKALEDGDVTELRTLSTGSTSGFAIPYRDGLVMARGTDPDKPADTLVHTDTQGTSLGTEQQCLDPRGAAMLRNVVAVSCEQGIALFTTTAGRVSSQLLEYGSRGPRATGLTFRPRSNYAAAPTPAGVWAINSATRTLEWTASADPIATAVAPGRDANVVELTEAATLRSVTIGDGRRIAAAEIPGARVESALTVDSDRAYLSAPATHQIVEVDHADALRIARTFPTDGAPELMVEVGR
ncbi:MULTISPECIES: hypothetical protein [unclassified Gordonia (in: high G+C Gram-positive bacteria)]